MCLCKISGSFGFPTAVVRKKPAGNWWITLFAWTYTQVGKTWPSWQRELLTATKRSTELATKKNLLLNSVRWLSMSWFVMDLKTGRGTLWSIVKSAAHIKHIIIIISEILYYVIYSPIRNDLWQHKTDETKTIPKEVTCSTK